MNHRRTFTLLVGLLALIVLSGCIGVEVVVESTPPSEDTALAPPTETLAEATAIPAPDLTAELPPAVFYDLGEATLIQDNFPADSRFRNMPAQLNGVMAVPVGDGPFPVVVMLHGTHPGLSLIHI